MFITLTKRGLAAVLLCAILGLSFGVWGLSQKGTVIDGSTHQKRMAYLHRIGYYPEENGQQKEVTLPKTFGAVYTRYNQIQKQGGFDLKPFRGQKATVFTYALNEKQDIHLITVKGTLVGGDIADRSVEGEMRPLGSLK